MAKSTVGNYSLRKTINSNVVRVEHFLDQKVYLARMQCSHSAVVINIPGPMGRHNQIERVLKQRMWHLRILHVLSFRGTRWYVGGIVFQEAKRC
jgi:hypothetical protein